MLEIDRYALARAAQFQAEVLAHYRGYEFHPVVAKLQLYCSEDLGGFYLDVLKDRLYTTAPKSLARRSAQTALWQITHAMLRWMAPFLSFTAEEAWKVFGSSESIFLETYQTLPSGDEALLAKWERHARHPRPGQQGNRSRARRGQGGFVAAGHVDADAPPEDHALLASLGEDLKFVFITSTIKLIAGSAMPMAAVSQFCQKCERCWHYRDDVGHDPPTPRSAAAAPATCTAPANTGRCA
jgi:isoleucyl-tRNA synthetase